MGATCESGAWQARQSSRAVSRLMPACSGRALIGFGFRPMIDRTMNRATTDTAMPRKIRSFLFIRASAFSCFAGLTLECRI